MKSTEIHNGLDKKEIRDFLAISLVELNQKSIDNQRKTVPHNSNLSPIDWRIKDCELKIEYNDNEVKILKQQAAVIKIMEMNGWQEYDVSDETINDTEYTYYRSFIGTQHEYDNLIKDISKEE